MQAPVCSFPTTASQKFGRASASLINTESDLNFTGSELVVTPIKRPEPRIHRVSGAEGVIFAITTGAACCTMSIHWRRVHKGALSSVITVGSGKIQIHTKSILLCGDSRNRAQSFHERCGNGHSRAQGAINIAVTVGARSRQLL